MYDSARERLERPRIFIAAIVIGLKPAGELHLNVQS